MIQSVSDEFSVIMLALVKLVIIAMLLERAMVLIFDYRWFKKKLDGYGLKVPITIIVSWMICHKYAFDVFKTIFTQQSHTALGVFITAAVVAGGSAAAITLFQGVFKFSKDAQEAIKETQKAEAEARKMKADADKAVEEARIKKATEG